MITGEFPPMPGGVGDFSRLLAERMRTLGHDVYLLSRHGTASETLPIDTVAGWGAGSMARIRSWVRDRQLDIVNLQFQTAAYDMSPFVHFLPKIISVPLITTFHDLRHPYLFPKAGPLRQWIVFQLARTSAGLITTNHEDDRRLHQSTPRRMIPIGSSIPRLDCTQRERTNYRRRSGADDHSFLLGHFGFVKPIKGVHYLLDSLSNLRKTRRDLKLVFIGARGNAVDGVEDARYLEDLDSQIERGDLADSVHWTGELPDAEVAAWFNAVDLMVFPFTDGASFRRSSLIAAIHQGCPILTTKPVVDIADFAHKRNLYLVEPSSATAIKDAILDLMHDRTQLSRLQNGTRHLRERFDWDGITRETIGFYETFG